METFTLVAVYFAVMFMTLPVMRFAFRNEIKPIVEETICYDQDVVVVETVAVEMKPLFHYSTETNKLVCSFEGWEPFTCDMSDKRQSKNAMEIIAWWNDEQQKAKESLEEAQELLFEVEDSIATKAERHRGHEWGVKSKLRK
jgi:hypothetical protein